MVFPNGFFLSWISLIFQFQLRLGIHRAVNNLFNCNNLYAIRSGIQIPLIAVADRFTRTEITYIQVTLPSYSKLRNFVNNIYLGYLYKSSEEGLHPYIFNVNIRLCVQYIPGLQKNFVSLRFVCVWGGGGGTVAICSPSPIVLNHFSLCIELGLINMYRCSTISYFQKFIRT